ncbi:MAG: hypothetical protein GXP35_16910, partial [Actinobacteria bacterium]|nr:hypothetical protein [Actinomycetota bacterium]
MRILRVFLCLAIVMPLAVSEQVGADEPPPWYTPALDEQDGQYVPVTPTIVPVVWETDDPQFSSYDNVCRVSLWALVEREDVYFSSFANTWAVRAVGFTTEGVPRLGQVSVHGPDQSANRIASISFPYLYRADRFHNDGPVDRRPDSPVYIDLSSSYGFRFFTQGEEWNDGDTNPCEPLLASIPDRIAEFSAQAQFVRERRDDEVDPRCTVEQSGTDGATLSFESAVPGSMGYLQEWTFSDGSTSTANSVSKVATEPGPYSGTFRVYRTDGSLDKSITCTAEVKSPTPSVDVRLVHDDASNESGRFALDEEFDVVVAASAANDGVGDITATQLDVTKLFDQAPNLEVLSGPTPALVNPLTLVSGAMAQEFTYRVKAAGPGRFRVDAAMTAMRDGVDRPVADVDVMRNGSVGSITLAAVATPESVELEEGDDGPEPKPVTVTVKITNPFDVPLTD